MAKFSVPSSPEKYILSFDNFRGVDFLSASSCADLSRASDAKNFIRGDEIGKIRKRKGYKTLFGFEARINGVYTFYGETYYHAGEKLYTADSSFAVKEVLSVDETAVHLEDTRSYSVNISGKLIIMDGTNIVYAQREQQTSDDGIAAEKTVFRDISDGAYVPTIVISNTAVLSGDPSSRGTAYEPVNLLTNRVRESFKVYGSAETRSFYVKLSFPLKQYDADFSDVIIERLTDGEWKTVGGTITYIGNMRKLGYTTAASSLGQPEGTISYDNYRVTYSISYAESNFSGSITDDTSAQHEAEITKRLNYLKKCRFGAAFGVNGAPDRLFISGNPDEQNIVRYSEFDNPLYFPDTFFAEIGGSESAVTGFSIVGTDLAVHKKDSPDGRNIFLVRGSLGDDGDAMFRVVNSLYGYGALTPFANAFLGNENLFLTGKGVYAVTASELTGERYSQSRSMFADSRLIKEIELENAYAHSFGDFYYLCINGNVYALDSLQKAYIKNAPYSSYQYECYFLANIPARVMWDDGTSLFFGGADGKIRKVFDDPSDVYSYNDDGESIEAYWQTPEISGGTFFLNKTFRYISLKLSSASQTGAVIYALIKGVMTKIFDTVGKAGYWVWTPINFSRISFSSDATARTIGGKVRIKKVDKISLRIINDSLNEPCGIYSLGLVYTQGNYFKG